MLNHEEVTKLVLLEAPSLREITDKLPQFKFNQDQGYVQCQVYKDIHFVYCGREDEDFSDTIMPK